MLQKRVIPILLLKGEGLYKTVNFKNPQYIGDPRNAIKIFNEKEVDELCILDIGATGTNSPPNFRLLEELASECFMPLSYGGGIKTLEQIRTIFSIGIEKIILNSVLFENINLLSEAVEIYGEQSIVASLDVKKDLFGREFVFARSGTLKIKEKFEDLISNLQNIGVGEFLITSINKEGKMEGLDLDLTRRASELSNVPIISSGGVGSILHIANGFSTGNASAVGVGSFVVYHGKHKAVLITYPDPDEIKRINDE